MPRRRNQIAAVCFMAIVSFAWTAQAGKVKCPVCGQVFEDAVEVCPNDGTDLVILGRPVEPEPEPLEGAGDPAEDVGGYKRQDLDGERQRAPNEQGGYQDRQSRIGEDWRGPELAERRRRERERRRQEFLEADRAIRDRFEERRKEMWLGRRGTGKMEQERFAAEGYEALRKQTLWGQAAPFASIGMRLSWMEEGADSGPVAGAELELNLLKRWFRLGCSVFFGARNLTGREDALFLGQLSVGVQRPWRYSPYLVARGGLGTAVIEREGEDPTRLAAIAGVEGGIDSRFSKAFVLTPSLGYVRHFVGREHWDSFTVKLSFGF